MNKPLRRIGIAAMLLILALIINVNYIQGSKADDLRASPLNNRQFLHPFKYDRGPIMAGDMTLAYSKSVDGDDENHQRVYNKSKIFSPVTGVRTLSGTATGLEGAENELLNGTDKRLTVRRWFNSFIGKPPKGATVEVTIDPKTQITAYKAIKEHTYNRGAAVAIDVDTGAILAMASYPSYDANLLATHDGDKYQKHYTAMTKQDGKPLLNKAMDETFAPGSSFKIVDSLAVIDRGIYDKDSPADATKLILPGSGEPLPNDTESGPCNSGMPPLIVSFAQSCNTTFGRIALKTLGAKKLSATAKKLGWGKRHEVAPGMKSAPSCYSKEPAKKCFDPTSVVSDNLARSGIGQSVVTATPLQMAMVAQTVANDGVTMKPYLVKSVKSRDGSEVEGSGEKKLGQRVSSDTAQQLQAMMRSVVQNGTAQSTLGGHDIAGKTGTAETGHGTNEAWFVGFAPANDPEVAFAVVNEGPSGSFGATLSGPVALRLVQAVLRK